MFLTKPEIDLYLDIAIRAAQESKIDKAKVGCVNLYASGLMSLGWNQMPEGPTYPDDGRLHSVHAEAAASSLAWKNGHSTKHHYKFISQEPCLACAKQAYSEGATAVVFFKPYGIVEGLRYLYSRGIDVVVRKENGTQPNTYFLLTEWYEGMPSDAKWDDEFRMYAHPLFLNDAQ
ncbi:putative deoxycytidylate deaminase [Acinetobacter phage DMU1]|nr:putative deoxycytidylate deaminase [Acinetobacter phage DMU1]